MEKIIGDSSTEIKLSGEEAKDICRLGQLEKCCAFLVMAPSGFECIRMSGGISRTIFSRLEKGTMNAKGRGEWKGCPWEQDKQKQKTMVNKG